MRNSLVIGRYQFGLNKLPFTDDAGRRGPDGRFPAAASSSFRVKTTVTPTVIRDTVRRATMNRT